MRTQVLPYVLAAAKEQALKPGDSFKERAQDCPEMVVVPAGSFLMGVQAADSQAAGYEREIPQYRVAIAKPYTN
jgi:formylglycine-generating enzyme required for sulfatase activity